MLSIIIKQFLSLFYIVPITEEYSDISKIPNYILDSVPYFFLLIFLEWLVSIYIKKTVYSFKDLLMSLSLGTDQQLFAIWMKTLKVVPYIVIYRISMPIRHYVMTVILPNYMITIFSSTYVRFFVGLLGCDLSYYIFHRIAHEYHIIWIGHGVHHSGERYNLATALRQGVIQSAFTWILYLPWAALGLSPIDYIRHDRLNTVYQFWIHTEFIGRLALILEMILNTPSHHRKHHNPPGNCNYAGVLIIWDRIFCTFVPEYPFPSRLNNVKEMKDTKEAIYGLAKPLNSFNPMYANISHFCKLFESQYNPIELKQSSSHQKSIKTFNQALWKVLGFIWKKRVDTKWKIAYTFQELFPDISPTATLSELLSFQSIYRLPVTTDENIQPSNIQDKKELEKKSSNYLFVKERRDREGNLLSIVQTIVVTVHFLFSMILSLVLMEYSKSMMKDQMILLILGCLICISSLQCIQWHYS